MNDGGCEGVNESPPFIGGDITSNEGAGVKFRRGIQLLEVYRNGSRTDAES